MPPLIQTIVVSGLAYAALIAVLRLAGKRTMAKWNAFDSVVTIAIGSVLATTITSTGTKVGDGLAAMVVLIALQFLVAWLAVRSPLARRLAKARPRLLLWHGEFDSGALREERVTRGEVLAAIRASGVSDVRRVAAVVLETDGSVSVIGRSDRTDDGMTALEDVDGYPTHAGTGLRPS